MTVKMNLFFCQIFNLSYRTVIDGFKSFKIFEELSNWNFDILHKNDIDTNNFIFAITDNFYVMWLFPRAYLPGLRVGWAPSFMVSQCMLFWDRHA